MLRATLLKYGLCHGSGSSLPEHFLYGKDGHKFIPTADPSADTFLFLSFSVRPDGSVFPGPSAAAGDCNVAAARFALPV